MKLAKLAICTAMGVLLYGGAVNAQVVRVIDAPIWFFEPPLGEYVGVSQPLDNRELAWQQAVVSALLSYVARNEVAVKYQEVAEMFEMEMFEMRGEAEDIKDRYAAASNCSFTLSVNYTEATTAVNQHGETFVLLRVVPGSSTTMQLFAEHHISDVQKNNEYKNFVEEFAYSIQLSHSTSNQTVEIYSRESTHNDKTTIEGQIEHATERSSAEETFPTERRYRYRPTATGREVMSNGDVYIKPSWIGRPILHSLGMAYTSALLRGIMQDSSEKGKTISAATRAVVDTTYTPTSIGFITNRTFSTTDETFIKPARKLSQVGIDTQEWLMIFADF